MTRPDSLSGPVTPPLPPGENEAASLQPQDLIWTQLLSSLRQQRDAAPHDDEDSYEDSENEGSEDGEAGSGSNDNNNGRRGRRRPRQRPQNGDGEGEEWSALDELSQQISDQISDEISRQITAQIDAQIDAQFEAAMEEELRRSYAEAYGDEDGLFGYPAAQGGELDAYWDDQLNEMLRGQGSDYSDNDSQYEEEDYEGSDGYASNGEPTRDYRRPEVTEPLPDTLGDLESLDTYFGTPRTTPLSLITGMAGLSMIDGRRPPGGRGAGAGLSQQELQSLLDSVYGTAGRPGSAPQGLQGLGRSRIP